jgi:hypothetical protein
MIALVLTIALLPIYVTVYPQIKANLTVLKNVKCLLPVVIQQPLHPTKPKSPVRTKTHAKPLATVAVVLAPVMLVRTCVLSKQLVVLKKKRPA